MRAHEALIAWTPCDDTLETRGQVRVGRLICGDNDWTAGFANTGGAARIDGRDWRGAKSIARVFLEFNSIVLRMALTRRLRTAPL